MHISMHKVVHVPIYPQNTVSERAEREIENRLLKKYPLLVCSKIEHDHRIQSYTDLDDEDVESVCVHVVYLLQRM